MERMPAAMSERDAALNGILLIERDSAQRKLMRKSLESGGHAVLAVNSMGEAMARLRSHHYDLVLCTDRHNSATISEDYGPIIDSTGMLARSAAGYELYLPGIGISARAVLIVPTTDPNRAISAVRDVSARLERMSGPQRVVTG
jgi:hypothetical protein